MTDNTFLLYKRLSPFRDYFSDTDYCGVPDSGHTLVPYGLPHLLFGYLTKVRSYIPLPSNSKRHGICL